MSRASDGTPRVTIGLPVYNGERFLEQTIESLLGQTLADFELVVSDNASTDRTEDICRRYAREDDRVRYCRSDVNRGAAWNYNNTFAQARGEYFKWAADDDLHEPSFLARCIDALEAQPDAVLAFAGTDFIDPAGHKLRDYPFPVELPGASRRELFCLYARGGHIVHEIFGVMRRELLARSPLIGGYVGSDVVLLGWLALRGPFVQVPEVLFHHREHGGRSTAATGGAAGFTNWFNTARSGRFAAPFWRRVYENTGNVLGAPMPARERLGCLWEVCRTANWNRRALLDDLVNLVRRNTIPG